MQRMNRYLRSCWSRKSRLVIVVTIAAVMMTQQSGAAVYNLRLTADNGPDYTDIQSLVRTTTAGCKTPEEKCIAIWRMARQSRRQTTAQREAGRVLYDPILHYNSYGALNCGIVSSLNATCWQQLDYQTRYVELGDHTVSEVSWDDGKTWHMFDSSMSYFCYNHEGQIASCAEIQESHACELSGGKSEPGHYYMYHGSPQCVSHLGADGWRKAGDEPVKYERTLKNGADSYTDGFDIQGDTYVRSGQRYVLNLQPRQTYTRYWQPLETVSAFAGQFQADECYRPVDRGDPNTQHNLGNIRGNGLWTFEPDFSDPACAELLHERAGVTLRRDGDVGARIHPATAGEIGFVVFKVAAANVITSLRMTGEIRRNHKADQMRILVSANAGISWAPVWESREIGPQAFDVRLRDEVAAVTECLVKFEMHAEADCREVGLDSLRIATVTQVNRRTLPGLTLGSNRVRLAADEQVESLVLWPRMSADDPRPSAFEEHNVYRLDVQNEAFYKASLGPARDNEPGHVIWRLQTPTELTGAEFRVIATNKSPRSFVATAVSFDGKTYEELDRITSSDPPFDELKFYELGGDRIPPGAREVYLRCSFQTPSGAGSYTMPGVQDVLLRAAHRPLNADFRPVEITYEWIEHRDSGHVSRSHIEIVESLPHEYVINTAGYRDPTTVSVRMQLVGSRGSDDSAKPGYSDGEDVGDAFERTPIRYAWGRNLAAGKPYAASRSSTLDNANPDTDGVELTNRKVIPPTEFINSAAVQSATAFWAPGEPVEILIDLGQPQNIAGVRVSSHQPNEHYCHPEAVHVDVSVDGVAWRPAGDIHHVTIWHPPIDYEPWEHDDDPDFAALPAGGRLAYSFSLVFDEQRSARFVRFVCAPFEGRGIGLSELEVFDKAAVIPVK